VHIPYIKQTTLNVTIHAPTMEAEEREKLVKTMHIKTKDLVQRLTIQIRFSHSSTNTDVEFL